MFSIGYLRAKGDGRQTRFYMCFALSMFGVMGVAMAGNLFTLFVFYEVITLASYPLVTHAGDAAARRAGRIYLGLLMGSSVMLLLPAIVGVWFIAGSTDFTQGGLLAGKADGMTASLLLAMIVFGAAKAALMPLHVWLPAAMVAPAPVSALLHAVAVVKAGVFTLLKASAYIFGPELIATAPAAQWLLWIASASIVIASLVALTRDDLKARLAWSTVAQLSTITSGALIAVGAGVVGGGLHMLTHAFGKITLFMCAGAIYVATGLTKVSEMRGLGREAPLVFACFLAASLSVIGLPPFGGMWSKFLLITAAFGAGQAWTAWAMIVSSTLSVVYLLPVAIHALAPTPRSEAVTRPTGSGSPGIMVAALVLTTIGSLGLFFLADAVATFLAPVTGAAP